MMKKTIAVVTALGLLLSTGVAAQSVEAKSDKNKSKKTENKNRKAALEAAMKRVKNEKAREAMRRTLERWAEQEKKWEDRDWDDDDNVNQADWDAVYKDKAALTIDFGGQDTSASVTVPFDSLPSRGANGSAITWVSSKPSVISNDGKTVNRPSTSTGDVKVVMTATLKVNRAVVIKAFTVTVKAQMSVTDAVAADKKELAIGFAQGDSATSVTRAITLPTTGKYGSSISWISGSPTLISNDGKTVNRPTASQGDATVVLTAIITKNGNSDVKTFTLTVKQLVDDVQAVAAAKAALAIGFQSGDSLQSITRPVTLPSTGLEGTTVTWISSNPSIISNDGKTVIRPANGSGDATLVLSALITRNGVTDMKTFQVVVKQQLTDVQKVAADKAALTIGFAGTDTAASVTGAVSLPTTGVNGSSIVWISSNNAVISDDGKTVVRPTGTSDVRVTLIAIIVSGGASDTKEFTVTVKRR